MTPYQEHLTQPQDLKNINEKNVIDIYSDFIGSIKTAYTI